VFLFLIQNDSEADEVKIEEGDADSQFDAELTSDTPLPDAS
jgi:hypothetical protein